MTLTPQLTFRNIDPDERVMALIEGEIAKLERYFPHLMSCHVTIQAPVRKSAHYRVQIDLSTTGKQLVVKRTPNLHETLTETETAKRTKSGELQRLHRQLKATVKDAFTELRRRLQDHARQLRKDVKQHEAAPIARIADLLPEQGYGFLQASDGRKIYFHQRAVLDGHFNQLRPGSEVAFVEEAGEKGPQASTVRLIHPSRQLRDAAGQVVLPSKRRQRVAKTSAKSA